jgi:hypothetical protein
MHACPCSAILLAGSSLLGPFFNITAVPDSVLDAPQPQPPIAASFT